MSAATVAATPRRINILGVGISAVNLEMALECVEDWIADRRPNYACFATVHGMVEAQREPSLRTVYNRAGLTTPDGMPLVWLSRLNGFRQAGRAYGPDLMEGLFARSAARGYRHFLYGGAPGVADRLAERLRARYPGVQIAGTICPPFRPLTPEEDATVVAEINAAAPDIVWVGLGAPKQERWVAEHVGRLQAPALLAVGAAFDFLSGSKRQAPRWMQRSGLEWLFRLSQEPQRLARRYLIYNPLFLGLVALQLCRLRRYHLGV